MIEIERLRMGGDCLAGTRINLDKDWTGMINELLKQSTLTV